MGPPGPAGGGGEGGGAAFGHNILDFGADPTGQQDSVAAIEAAMKASGGHSYGRIMIPRGNYKLSRPVNLDLSGDELAPGRAGYHFIGEAHCLPRWSEVGASSLLIAPPNGYCFEQVIMGPHGGNLFAGAIFENLYFQGYGGIHLTQSSPTVRNCAFNCWRGCVCDQVWNGSFENIVMRSWESSEYDLKDRMTGCVGLAVHTSPNAVIRNFNAMQFPCGTALSCSGMGVTMEGIHIETSRVGMMLGYAPNPDALTTEEGYPVTAWDAVTVFARSVWIEACLIGIFCNNAHGSIDGASGQTHEIYSGHVFPGAIGDANNRMHTLCGVYIKDCRDMRFENIGFTKWCTQASVLTNADGWPSSDGWSMNAAFRDGWAFNKKPDGYKCQNNYRTPAGVSYPAGTTKLKLERGSSYQFPRWLVPGLKVTDEDGQPGMIPANTTVTAIDEGAATITLSNGITSAIQSGGKVVNFWDTQGARLGHCDWSYTVAASYCPI